MELPKQWQNNGARMILNSTEERALKLLGAGASQAQTAAALGVDPSLISQMMAQEDFSQQVAAPRFEHAQKHNERDATYDTLEDKTLKQLDKYLPMVTKPMELTRILATLNAAKRRGTSAPEQIIQQTQVVNLILPTAATPQFVVGGNNQVVRAGDQNLVTIQPHALTDRLKQRALPNAHDTHISEANIISTATETQRIQRETTPAQQAAS